MTNVDNTPLVSLTAHFSRSWGKDPFAPECGCGLAPCGKVDSKQLNPDCKQHNGWQTIRSAHSEADCPGEEDNV